MTSNVIRFPKARQVTSTDRLAARRAYRKGMDQLAIKAIENAFMESANIPGVNDILLKDAQVLFIASMRRALIQSIK